MSEQLIVNLTEGNYFSYDGDYNDYNEKLIDLYKKDRYGNSHWCNTDKVVFVPCHLISYVKSIYGKLMI